MDSSPPYRVSHPLHRRTWLGGCLATTAVAAFAPHTARADGVRVLLLGDSMIAGALGLYLQRALRDGFGYTLERRGKSSSGLARPDFFNWPAEAERRLQTFEPDAVVAMFGGNDGQGLHMGKKHRPQWIRWNDPGWVEEYSRRVASFCDVISPKNQRIFWIGMPVMRPKKLHRRVAVMNDIFRHEMVRRGGRAEFIPLWGLLADADGDYADRLRIGKKRVRVRAGDGVHLTSAGARYVVDHVAPTIHASLSSRT